MRRFSSVLFALGALALGPAHAACPKTLDRDLFEELAGKAQAAIDDDDLVRHGQMARTLNEAIPCLEGQVPVDLWAEFLIGQAVVDYALGKEWKHFLDAALRVKPEVRRDFGPVEIKDYFTDIELEPLGAPALPTDAEYYVDGRQVKHEPALGPFHIVQQRKEGLWTTKLVRDGVWPEAWKAERVETPDGPDVLSFHTSVYLLGGYAAGAQKLGSPDPLIGTPSGGAALLGLGTFGGVFPSVVGGFWDVGAPLRIDQSPAIEAWLGPAVAAGPVAIHLGGGVNSVTVNDIDGDKLALLPQPHLGARFAPEISDGVAFEAIAGGGAALSGWHFRSHLGFRGGGDIGWSGGLTASLGTGAFLERTGNTTATVSATRIGVRMGVALGRKE